MTFKTGSTLLTLVLFLTTSMLSQGEALSFRVRNQGTQAIRPRMVTQQKPELYVQTGHSDKVRTVAFSPDRRLLASGGNDYTIKLWDIPTGKEVRTLTGHLNRVLAMAFSPNGKLLASAGRHESHVKLWDLSTGAELRRIDAGTNAAVAFSPDGQMLAVASYDDGVIKLWKVNSGTELTTLQTAADGGSVTSVAFSPDGRMLASIEVGTTLIKLWEVNTGRKITTLHLGNSLDGLVAFSRYGPTLLSYTTEGVSRWDAATGNKITTIPVDGQGPVFGDAFSPDGKLLGSKKDEHEVELIEAATGKRLKSARILDAGVSVESLAFSPDGDILAMGDDSGSITLWDVNGAKEIASLKGHAAPVYRVAYSPDGKTIASGSDDKTVKLWNTSSGGLTVLTGHSAQVRSVAFSPNGHTLASGSEDQTVRLWDMATAGAVNSLKPHELNLKAIPNLNGFDALAFSPDGKTLAGLASSIYLWDVESGRELAALAVSDEPGTSLSFSPDGQMLACGDEQTIKIWDVTTGKELRALGTSSRVGAVVFSPDRKTLVSTGEDGTLKLWDVKSGVELRSIKQHTGPVYSVAFSPDGKMLASASADKTVRLGDATTYGELRRIVLDSDIPSLIAFSPDGKTLISGSITGRTYLWDIETGKALASLIALDQKEWAVATPDGRFDGTAEGIKLIHYVQDNKPIPLDAFFEQFYTPKLLQRVLARETTPVASGIIDFAKPIRFPPLVRIISPKPGATSDSDIAQLVVEATDQGGGVEDIKLYQNGKLVSDDTRQLTRENTAKTKTFEVTLLPGVNTFRATAFNTDRTEATPDEIKIELKAVEASSNLYILAIGLNEYKNTRYNLNYGRADAKAFADAVERRGRGIFKEINTRVMFDADATRANIEAAFSEIIKQARPQDAFVFYYAGHGVMSESDDKNPADFYLVPYEVVRIYGDDGGLTTNGIAARNLRELLKNVSAQKQLIVLDACESGGAVETMAMRGASEEKAIMQLARSAGVAVLASAGQDQVATEFGKLGHGVFTYALLKGLSGEADGAPRDGKITIKELEAYINDQVPELTKLYRGKRQDPNSWTRGQDFPIAIR